MRPRYPARLPQHAEFSELASGVLASVFGAVGGDRAPRESAEVGHAEMHCSPLVDLGELGFGSREAHLQSFDFTEPPFPLGLGDPCSEVLDDLDESGPLVRVRPENGASDAGLTELILKQFSGMSSAGPLTEGDEETCEVRGLRRVADRLTWEGSRRAERRGCLVSPAQPVV